MRDVQSKGRRNTRRVRPLRKRDAPAADGWRSCAVAAEAVEAENDLAHEPTSDELIALLERSIAQVEWRKRGKRRGRFGHSGITPFQ